MSRLRADQSAHPLAAHHGARGVAVADEAGVPAGQAADLVAPLQIDGDHPNPAEYADVAPEKAHRVSVQPLHEEVGDGVAVTQKNGGRRGVSVRRWGAIRRPGPIGTRRPPAA